MFLFGLFGQSEFESDTPDSEDGIKKADEDEKEAIALAQEKQQEVLDKEKQEDEK